MNNIEKLQASMLQGLDAAIILSEHNRLYFTGFAATDGILFITENKAVLLADSRYIEAAREQAKGCEVKLLTNRERQLCELIEECRVKTAGIEAYDLPVHEASELEKILPDIKIDKSDALSIAITRLRMIKSNDEIEKITRAQTITDKAFDHILKYIKPGTAERDIALEIEYFMKTNGATGPSFELIAVSGENSSRPHGVPGTRKLRAGDFLTLDIGAVVDGYCSDMTRTVAIGKISDEQKKVYNTVLAAQIAAEKAVKPGMKCADIDKIARDIIDDAGYKGCFGHGLGHSVGLQIHEQPSFSPRCGTVLESGMIMTVEPGIYLEGRFGVRIEDLTLVTDDGISIFTKSPKTLITL